MHQATRFSGAKMFGGAGGSWEVPSDAASPTTCVPRVDDLVPRVGDLVGLGGYNSRIANNQTARHQYQPLANLPGWRRFADSGAKAGRW
jgi:hypothetical protein